MANKKLRYTKLAKLRRRNKLLRSIGVKEYDTPFGKILIKHPKLFKQ